MSATSARPRRRRFEAAGDTRDAAEEHARRGKQARAAVPRAEHAALSLSAERDPVAVLREQATTRVVELVPIRHGRMMASPASFYRGAAAVMAADLSRTPVSGFPVQLCGDAHMLNFGGFASPERSLVFDLNDFDETYPGPWEWDLKRLATSVEINARERGLARKQRTAAVAGTVAQYREAIRRFATMANLELWYSRLDKAALEGLLREQARARQVRNLRRAAARGRQRDSTRALRKLTMSAGDDGPARIVHDPPLLVPLSELLPADMADAVADRMRELLAAYQSTLEADRRRLLERFAFADMARKVVGVGSVGTRCWIVLMIGRVSGDPLFLQCKEAQPSVLAPYVEAVDIHNQGQRVVEGQRLMQASSDIFLGWLRNRQALDDEAAHDFYVRQLWDWKLSADVSTMEPDGIALYARACAWSLARAHARSGDAIAIGAYAGGGSELDRALVEFATSYADQNERDHAALVDAVGRDELAAITDV